jgi:hypothetical protein
MYQQVCPAAKAINLLHLGIVHGVGVKGWQTLFANVFGAAEKLIKLVSTFFRALHGN